MRTFGTNVDNLIDVELAYGTNNYTTSWYQNGLPIVINVTKGIFHYVGSKIPVGNVLKDYVQIETDYLDFLEDDAIGVEFIKEGVAVNVGTFYVAPGYTKTTHKATYTAYSSLIDLGIKLDKWGDAPSNATISTIVHHFIDSIEVRFDIEPTNPIEFNASVVSFENMTLQQLLGYCAFLEGCNYKLVGNVLYKINTSTQISKEYDVDSVVYSENLSQRSSDKVLDFIKVNYSVCTTEIGEGGDVSYDFTDASYVSKGTTEMCGFDVSFGLVPCSVDSFLQYVDTYFALIKGMDWNDYDVSFLGDVRVELGDKLCFKNNDITAVLNVGELKWTWDGALRCEVTSGSATISSDSGSGFNLSQIVSQIQAMGNALRNVQYNAVNTNMLHAKIAQMGYASIDELTVEVAKMGLMTAEQADIKYMTVSSADMRYATIDLSNIANGTITNAMIATGAIGTAQIADGSITDAKIVGLTANKITAGTLDAGTIEVINLNAANITVGTINGHQIASGAISLDNLANDVTNKLAETEEDVAQAVADAKQAILGSESATSVANTANSNASTALSTANSANTNANTALSTANTAKTTADAAQKEVYATFYGGGNSALYCHLCTITTNAQYQNGWDIVIETNQRGYGNSICLICFNGNQDAALAKFRKNGRSKFYIVKSATYTWDVYVKKSEAWDGLNVVGFSNNTTFAVKWVCVNASLPNGTTEATQMAGQAEWCYENDITYINGGKLYTGTVVANAIAAGAIVSDKIASSAVTAVKIAAGAIETDKLAANAVTATKIASGTITATQIASSTITGAKIASSTITSTNIASSAITTDKLVASAVTAAQIASGAITTDKLAANAVTAAKIASGTITATQIASSTITAAKLNVTSLSAISANLGTVTAGIIKSTNYASGSTGMKLDLSTGVWDSKYFKLSNTGAVTATSGKIGCFDLTSTGLSNSVLKILSNGSNTAQFSVYKPSVTDPIFDVGMSSSWNYFTVTAMNEINLKADDVYLAGNIWVKNDISTEDGISLRGLNNTCYKNSGGNFGTNTALFINGNALSYALSQLDLEYSNSHFRIRNDGSATYFMNGNASAWTNYAYMDTAGNWTFNGGQVLKASGLIQGTTLRGTSQASATCTNTVNCFISSDGTVMKTSSTSSARYKDDIYTDLCEELNPQHLYDINVVQFKYKKDHFTNTQDIRYRKDLIGFIAEDVYEKYPIAADYYINEKGESVCEGWNPQYMIPAMLKLIQEQHKRIVMLEEKLVY